MDRSISVFSKHAGFKKGPRDIGLFFSSIPPWVLFALVVVMCVFMAEAGVLIGLFRFRRGLKVSDASIATTVAAMLGLLAFMLGFTFSLTWTRFSARANLLIAHSKAISTSYLRTSLLPESQKKQIRKLLLEYTSILLTLPSTIDIPQSLKRIEEIQLAIWQQTVSLAGEEMDSELRSLFTASVNEVITLYMERKTVSLVFRIPNSIWTSLMVITALSMLAYGYQMGISGANHVPQMILVAAAFGMVIILISDIDSLTLRRFRISQKPMEDVKEMMEQNSIS